MYRTGAAKSLGVYNLPPQQSLIALVPVAMPPKSLKSPIEADKWVPVTWMPHTSLSTFSHVGITIRSAHAVIDHVMMAASQLESCDPEWKCRVGLYGVAGMPMLPVPSVSPPARAFKRDPANPRQYVVTNATHDCDWEWSVSLPIRWRDLPRDAYLLFELMQVGSSEEVLYRTTLPLFSRYGRMHTGLRKLQFQSEKLDPRRNYGLISKEEDDVAAPYGTDDDPVWKAVSILKSIERNEDRARTRQNFNETFGEIPTISWLDELEKERCRDIIEEHAKNETVRTSSSMDIL